MCFIVTKVLIYYNADDLFLHLSVSLVSIDLRSLLGSYCNQASNMNPFLLFIFYSDWQYKRIFDLILI